MADSLIQVVEKVSTRFGISLKEKQSEAIVQFMSGRDVFVSLPTGYGKSLIYALLPPAYDLYKEQEGSIVICVSPLTALMMDQKAKFEPKGIMTEFVGEEQTDDSARDRVFRGSVQLVYISPESLVCNPMFRNMILSPVYKEKMIALVVDEAHCVKSWGDSFRKAYAHLGDIRSLLPTSVHIMALTATATTDTYKTVCQRLSLKDPVVIGCPPNRQNIKYEVEPLIEMDTFASTVARELKIHGLEYPKTIIFFRRYTDCAALYQVLKKKLDGHITFPPDYPVLQQFVVLSMYTRASKIEMKERVLASFCDPKGVLRIVLATTAFGMGVDCSDVRVIYHWGPPSGLEEYMQESGRAGRDGRPSKAILLYGKPGKFVNKDVKEYGLNTTKCRHALLLKSFLFNESTVKESSDSGNDVISCCDISTALLSRIHPTSKWLPRLLQPCYTGKTSSYAYKTF